MLACGFWARVSAVAVLAGVSVSSGPAARADSMSAVDGNAREVGAWASPVALPSNIIGVHAVVLRTGKVLLMGEANPRAAFVFDPTTDTGHYADPLDNVFCGGQTLLADGTVLFAGGLAAPPPARAAGIRSIDTFDPINETWTRQPLMANGRWYPTTTTLGDGSVLIDAGRSQVASILNNQVELFRAGPPATVSLFGPDEGLDDYPHQYVLPDGKLFATTDGGKTVLFDPAAKTWSALDSHAGSAGRPAGVLLPGGQAGSTKIMLLGGQASRSPDALATTEVFDTANPKAGWVSAAPIPQGRNDMNTVILPDGTLLGVGGNSSGDFGLPDLQTLLYSPTTNSWTSLASQRYRRGYHSTAVLLPDGRVLSAGDTGGGAGDNTLEIYSPPYLFAGPRPSITRAPTDVTWGQQFRIRTSAPITRAVLVSPGATTHNDDMNQRHIDLAVTPTARGARLTAPLVNVAPPGYYMLFVLSSSGVPSVATWVHVAGPAGPAGPAAPASSVQHAE